jgi:hypothetical protein
MQDLRDILVDKLGANEEHRNQSQGTMEEQLIMLMRYLGITEKYIRMVRRGLFWDRIRARIELLKDLKTDSQGDRVRDKVKNGFYSTNPEVVDHLKTVIDSIDLGSVSIEDIDNLIIWEGEMLKTG